MRALASSNNFRMFIYVFKFFLKPSCAYEVPLIVPFLINWTNRFLMQISMSLMSGLNIVIGRESSNVGV